MLITLVEYAKKHNKKINTCDKMAQRGRFGTACKLGRDWVIDSEEPYPDARIKSGKYISSRNKKNKTE